VVTDAGNRSPADGRSWTPSVRGAARAAPELWLCSAVSRTVPFDRAAVVASTDPVGQTVLVGSDPELRAFGELQQSLDEGPGIELFRTAAAVVLPDLHATGTRWPILASSGLADVPVRSLMLLPLSRPSVAGPAGPLLGFVTCGRTRVEPFTAPEVAVLARMAGLVREMVVRRLGGLAASMDGEVDGAALGLEDDDLPMATGMVMARNRTDPAGALTGLRAEAFLRGCTIHELARDIVAGRLSAAVLRD
jgi:hypothetical protein